MSGDEVAQRIAERRADHLDDGPLSRACFDARCPECGLTTCTCGCHHPHCPRCGSRSLLGRQDGRRTVSGLVDGVGRAALVEAVARWLYENERDASWDHAAEWVRSDWYPLAAALLDGPLADLLAQAAADRAAVQRGMSLADELQSGTSFAGPGVVAYRIRHALRPGRTA